MDQSSRTRPRPTTTNPSNERENDATKIEIHAGPFNFSTMQGENHQISNQAWKVLENCKGVKSGRADIDDPSQITP
jgi:hypothetical protein